MNENNKLIAEFMGYFPIDKKNGEPPMYEFVGEFSINGFPYSIHPYCLRFHDSWDWLMPVVEKILHNTKEPKGGSYKYCDLYDNVLESLNTVNILEIYEQVFKFIEWYNKNK